MGREEFFNATKLLHNSLQGDPNTLTSNEWELFDHYNEMNARSLDGDWDVIIVHDPQPVGMRHSAADRGKHWVWRCHIDLSEPNPEPIERLLPLISEYDASVWHMEQYVPAGLDGHGGVRIVPPAIDPLSPKNMALSPDDASYVCDQFGIDVDRPLICQVSRFDPWKDPIGVIDAYRIVTKEIPEVQLALVGSMATDDPEGWEFFQRTFEYADSRPGHQDPEQPQQRRRDRGQRLPVTVRRSHAEVDPRGLRADGDRGALEGPADDRRRRRRHPAADRRWPGRLPGLDPEDSAQRSLEILADPDLGRRLGRAGKERARERFLTPRLLLDWLRIFSALEGA